MLSCKHGVMVSPLWRVSANLVFIGAIVALSGCGPLPFGSRDTHPATPSAAHSQADLARSAQYWHRQYQKNPKSRNVALNYAKSLRAAGQTTQAVAVMQQISIAHPHDGQVLSAFAKTLAANGDYRRALKVIENTTKRDNPDWSLLSTEAAIYDQMGNHERAREIYQQALVLAPGEPSVLNNLGMSYILTGQLTDAEDVLRQAAKSAGSDTQVRQNLALALGLQGKFEEAETILKRELPADQANRNIAYLRDMLSQPNSWKKLSEIDGKEQIGLRIGPRWSVLAP